jgi:hypothetical protein
MSYFQDELLQKKLREESMSEEDRMKMRESDESLKEHDSQKTAHFSMLGRAFSMASAGRGGAGRGGSGRLARRST